MSLSSLSMIETKLPPGFRFHPRDEELVCDYLVKKLSAGSNGSNINGSSYGFPMIIDVDLNKCEPWDLPDIACVGGKEWYFYSLKDRKYATGQRTNRATQSGYWKATGKDRQISRKGILVGMRKTLVFYEGRAPKGKKTEWVMHEFRAEGPNDQSKFSNKDDWVLCRVFYKSRGSSSKLNTETFYDDEMGSSSLPSLTDNYITFEQAPLGGYEQVPCFSNFSQNSASQSTNAAASHVPLVDRNLSFKSTPNMATLPDFSHCDNKVLKAVLNHFKLEVDNKPELLPNATQGNFETYLSENVFPYVWTPI